MPSKSFNLKAAVAVTAAVLSVAGVAAAATTGRSTGPAEQAAAQAALAPRGGTPTSAHGAAARDATGPARDSSATGKTHDGPVGPDATGPAKDGLCQAWRSGQGGDNGGRRDSTAFQALAKAAGGADKVDAFCQTADTSDPAANGQGQGSRPDDVPRSGDHGNGQGGPPTASG